MNIQHLLKPDLNQPGMNKPDIDKAAMTVFINKRRWGPKLLTLLFCNVLYSFDFFLLFLEDRPTDRQTDLGIKAPS